ncbi:MAG: hypothetical protein PHW62_00080 [Candidatus Ratteibacteria bacterium]|nr:hypothetical protein [Candidatus Ratteibacteria bacterium]
MKPDRSLIGNEFIKEWINNSKTYRKILEHRKTCKKQRRGKFCIECTGGDLEDVVMDFEHEILNEMNFEWDCTQRTDRFMSYMRLRVTTVMPKSLQDTVYKEIMDYIKDLKGNNALRTDIFMMCMRLRATLAVPKSLKDAADKEIIDYITDLTHKGQSEEIEVS